MNLSGQIGALHAYGRRIQRATWLHAITVEPYLGTGSYGPRYGEPVTLSPETDTGVLVDETTRMVRASDGTEVVSSTTIDAPVSQAGNLTAGSRITLSSGATTTIISCSVREGGPQPDRVQVACE